MPINTIAGYTPFLMRKYTKKEEDFFAFHIYVNMNEFRLIKKLKRKNINELDNRNIIDSDTATNQRFRRVN